MWFEESAGGMTEMELVCAAPEKVLCRICEAGIPLYEIRQTDPLTRHFYACRKDLGKIRAMAEKMGGQLRLRSRIGVYWTLKGILRRPILTVGILLLLLLTLYLPTRVLIIRVKGNETVPENKILAAATECGIRIGANRRALRSEKLKNQLIARIPELQWVGINTNGCEAVISVRERQKAQQKNEPEEICSIISVRDGVIESCTADRGNLLCYPGQTVREGQILISAYTDCGISIRATQAKGEIYAQTVHDLVVVSPAQYQIPGEIIGVKHKYSLLIGKKRINLWKDSGIWDTTCDRMYEEYYITLPGGVSLPVALVIETCSVREMAASTSGISDMHSALSDFAENYLLGHMIAGQVMNRNVILGEDNGALCLTGYYLCREMIGRYRQEKIGE